MKKTILKISMAIAVLMFVITGVSWADGGKNRQRNRGSEPRVHSKHDSGRAYRAPVHYKRAYKKQHRNSITATNGFKNTGAIIDISGLKNNFATIDTAAITAIMPTTILTRMIRPAMNFPLPRRSMNPEWNSASEPKEPGRL